MSGYKTAAVPIQEGQTFGNFTASHLANAAFTATGHSCAIQWPDWIMTSVRSSQYCRIGSARREPPVVRQVRSLAPSKNNAACSTGHRSPRPLQKLRSVCGSCTRRSGRTSYCVPVPPCRRQDRFGQNGSILSTSETLPPPKASIPTHLRGGRRLPAERWVARRNSAVRCLACRPQTRHGQLEVLLVEQQVIPLPGGIRILPGRSPDRQRN